MSVECLAVDEAAELAPTKVESRPPPLTAVCRTDPSAVREPSHLLWRAHDRTHLEFVVPLEVSERGAEARFQWEAYFFVPESFRLDETTYAKASLDEDFKSYVRLAVGESSMLALTEALEPLAHALRGETSAGVTALRLFACRLRRVLYEELSRVERGERTPSELAADAVAMLASFRSVASGANDGGDGELAVAFRWVDEDLSLSVEATLVRLGRAAMSSRDGGEVDEGVVELAVKEARYRKTAGYAAVVAPVEPDVMPASREMERLEFRRHKLKRFTASVLWLDMHAEDPARWAKHVLYALAAGFAMAFAVLAALWNGPVAGRGELGIWLAVAVVAYAVKDRMKAGLQDLFSGVLSSRYADRRWRIRRRRRGSAGPAGDAIGVLDERSGFKSFAHLPEQVLTARRITREHPIEEEARPETVLWHRKTATIAANAISEAHAGLLEIFRVDLRRWLVNTDEAKNKLLFADPARGCVDEVVAPRVYNIAIVYRLRDMTHAHEGEWQRTRVVVTRKGIRRIEPIARI